MIKYTQYVKCLIISVLALSGVAEANIAAGTPHFSWTVPTQDDKGQTLPSTGPGALTDYKLFCDGALLMTFAATETDWQSLPTSFAVGSHTCYLVARNGLGGSVASNTQTFSQPIVFSKPKPAILTVD